MIVSINAKTKVIRLDNTRKLHLDVLSNYLYSNPLSFGLCIYPITVLKLYPYFLPQRFNNDPLSTQDWPFTENQNLLEFSKSRPSFF